MSPEEKICEVTDLVFQYPDGTLALNKINLNIYSNQFIAIIGQNGSGKTTLSKCLNGLLKPTHGSVLVEGIDVKEKRNVKKIVTKIGYVFQNPDHQLFNNTVFKDIAYGPRNIGLSEEEVQIRVKEVASVCGIDDGSLEEHPYFLTKGLRQRVAIASILSMRPRIIVVDEPTTGQDMRQSIEVMNFLRDLWKNEGHTIVIITHEMPIVARYAQRVVVLCEGRLLMDGTTREVFSKPEILEKSYVKPPQITQLAHALKNLGILEDALNVTEMYESFLDVYNGAR
jgi:energy-coupling factor transport system ATP-binding protein